MGVGLDGVSWAIKVDPARAGATRGHRASIASILRRHSTSGGPLPCLDRPAKAAWLHLAPHGRPSFIMADVAVRRCRDGMSQAAQMAVLRDFSRRTSTSSSSTTILNKGELFTASQGAWLQPGLELSNPLTLPSLDHMLTSTFLNPHRSLDRRRLRHRRPRLDGPRPRARWHDRCRRHQPLRRPRTRLERGTLV